MKFKAVSAALLLISSGVAMADGTLTATGFTVEYTTAAQHFFGDPFLASGDVLTWHPSSFAAVAAGPNKVVSSLAQVTITANAGYDLTTFDWSENGTYAKTGTAGRVSATGSVDVAPIIGPSIVQIQQGFTTGALLTTDGDLKGWSTSAPTVTVIAGTKKVSFDVINTLIALGGVTTNMIQTDGGSATLSIGVTPVPEPESYAMVLAGLGVIGLLVRRRNQI